MDASKQISTINLGKWVTFRKLVQSDQSFESRIFIEVSFSIEKS